MVHVNRRGKSIAISTAVLGVVVLVAAGVAGKERIREEWYLHQLGSADDATRLHAAGALGEMKSIRAVPENRIRILMAG